MSSSAQLPAAYGLNNSMQASDSALSAAAVCAVNYGLPYIIGQAIIFLPCDFYHSFFFSSPNLSGRRLDVYHISTRCGLSPNLECRSEMCCMRLAGNTERKNRRLLTIA